MTQVPTGNDPRAQGGLRGPWESRTGDALPPLPLQGLEIIFRVGLALLQVNQTELMQLDMEGMSQVGRGPGWWVCPQQGHLGK